MKKLIIVLLGLVIVSCGEVAPSPPPPSPDFSETIPVVRMGASVIDQLFPVSFDLEIPETLGVGQVKEVILEIVPDGGEGGRGAILVSASVGAEASSPTLTIVNHSPYRQLIINHAPTQWRWSIVSNQPVDHELTISVRAFVMFNGEMVEYQLETYRRTVSVETTWQARTLYWWSQQWQWSFTSILLPFGVWLWTRRKKTRSE